MSPNSITITTDRLPHPKVMGNSRAHWREKAALIAEEKEFMFNHLLAISPVSELRFKKARATYNFWNNKEIDWDNFLTGCKAWMDAIVEFGILVDDKPSVLSIVLEGYHKCKKGEEKVVIYIEELE